ncbi:glycosyltransferase family 2 protein [Saliphagus sp. LR7]|uniref:glycosyltransferase n=1 Tax=Saliphagus sp. LR7 TaxID=2282654 RepID=UPI000DF7AC9B|nr:glycosyltransferase [Saliphagus sp. LR7]
MDHEPSVAVCVPVYNDPEGVRTTVESLRPQTDDRGAPLCVVDNASTDETPDVIRRYASEGSVTHLREGDVQSSYAARNTAVRNTESEVLAFVDADMTVPEGWLESALATFRSADADYMGCTVELTLPETPSLVARYDHHTGFPVEQYIDRQRFSPTCCLFVRREVFEDVGLFDHRLISGGDKEFGNRVHDAGYEMHFASDVTMFHPVRDSLPALVRKDFRVGRGLCQLQRYHPERYGTPGVPPRPTGVKSPDRSLPLEDRLAFGALAKAMVGVRGLGYGREYLAARRDSGEGSRSGPPELDFR